MTMKMKKQMKMLFVLCVLTSLVIGTGLLTIQTNSDYTVTMKSAKIRITTVQVITDLPNGDYTLKVGVRGKRVLGSYWGVFQTSDSNYKNTGMKWYIHPQTIEGGNNSAGTYYYTDLNTDWCYTVELDESGFEYYVSFKLKKGWISQTNSFYLGSSDNEYDTSYWTDNVWYGKYGAYLRFQYMFIFNA